MPPCNQGCEPRACALSFTLPADIELVAAAVKQITDLARAEMNCPSEVAAEIDLAVQEGLINAIIHGCHNDATKNVQCWVACDADKGMLIVIRDPGKGFDVDSIPHPLGEEQMNWDHGRGVFLIHKVMNRVHFQRNGAEIHMLKLPTLSY